MQVYIFFNFFTRLRDSKFKLTGINPVSIALATVVISATANCEKRVSLSKNRHEEVSRKDNWPHI